MSTVVELAVKLMGAAFLVLGALWVGLGFWLSDIFIIVGGGLAGAAGVVLLGLAPRMDEESEQTT